MLGAFLMLLATVQSPNIRVSADGHDVSLGHLRTRVPRIVQAIAKGYERSITFRRLVDDVKSGRGVVYIDAGRCKPTGLTTLNGCIAPRAHTENAKYFQMIVDSGRSDDRLIALIGHELQHACEMLSVPGSVRNAVEAMSWRAEQTGARILETEQARAVTAVILKELTARQPSR